MNRFRTLTVAAALMLAAVPAQAQLIDFEDRLGGPVPNGYMGFNWNNFNSILRAGLPAGGYQNMDGNAAIFNANGNPATVSGAGTFHFHSALIGAAWNNGLNVQVQGLLDGDVLFSSALTVGTAAAQTFVFGWSGINGLRFVTSGGVHAGYAGSGTHIMMDNMVFGQQQQVVPEPITMVLLGTGLAFVGAMRRRRMGMQA
jgi:hypothetical protein